MDKLAISKRSFIKHKDKKQRYYKSKMITDSMLVNFDNMISRGWGRKLIQ